MLRVRSTLYADLSYHAHLWDILCSEFFMGMQYPFFISKTDFHRLDYQADTGSTDVITHWNSQQPGLRPVFQ